MPLKRKKENPETQSSAPSEESSPMNSQESPCQGLSQASNEESSLMDENKADPSPTQESSNEEQRYQLHLNTMDQQQPTSIPEELRALFPPDLLKAAYSLVEDYRRMDPFNTNLREFFSLLTEFTIKTAGSSTDPGDQSPADMEMTSSNPDQSTQSEGDSQESDSDH
ncbi:uncharacterized protein LOC127140919 isoform X5 [Lates calcarifer]|uniref:Uncharacterized protein LOC127140919 isoform X5 n=1 Tax=Lates calcarifer TaxID=8187 RepID=A0AAJ8B257_LATCA|nr:uncharacterized protein LOC127140919 isoform X5 [Lates calcarifer]